LCRSFSSRLSALLRGFRRGPQEQAKKRVGVSVVKRREKGWGGGGHWL
jgi:hypothetical protein